jgi:NitT/TauT family transport system permease protein
LIFWFGLGFSARVVIIYLFSVFVITVNTLQGAKHTPGDFVELAHSFGASRRYIVRHIVIPYAIPYIMVGLRLGVGRAMRGVVVSELILSVTGIGIIVSNYSAFFRIDGLLAVAVAIMAAGIFLAGLVQWIENVVAPWKKKGSAFQD